MAFKTRYENDGRQIVRTIRNLYRHGEPLNIHAVKRLHPELIDSVYSMRPFLGWAGAIRAAGLDYRKIRTQLQETVTCQICRKEFRNLTIHLLWIHEVDAEEYKSSFPGEYLHSESLRASRSDSLFSGNPLIEHWEPLWSEEYILDRIQEYYRRGIPVNDGYMHDKDRALEGVATKYFGSWDAALKKAGLNPKEIRRQALRILYDREDVIRELRKRYRSGKPVNHSAVQSEDISLCNAARKRLRTYSAALTAAGIDPSKVRLQREPYTKADKMNLLKAIRKTVLIPEGEKRIIAIRRLRKKYAKMQRRIFKSWHAAAEAAGVKYQAISLHEDHRDFSTQEKVIRALKKRVKEGKSLVAYFLRDDDRPLYKTVRHYFPNYYDCYAHVGLDPSEVRGQRRYASADAVIAAVKRRGDLGLGLRVADLALGPKQNRDHGLLRSAFHFFGSWKTALNFANIDPAKKRPPNSPSSSTIVKQLKEKRRKAGRS